MTAILAVLTTAKTAEADFKRMLGTVHKPLTKYFQAAAQGTNGAEVLFSVRDVELLCSECYLGK